MSVGTLGSVDPISCGVKSEFLGGGTEMLRAAFLERSPRVQSRNPSPSAIGCVAVNGGERARFACTRTIYRGKALNMFAKIFSQIFESSIAENCRTRHVFMDLLVLCDSDGVVDMTAGAIARRTNVPLEQVVEALAELSRPDADSRTPGEDGRRILPIDERRGWGWQIVNYHHYRRVRDEEARREYFREYRRKEREGKRGKKKRAKLELPPKEPVIPPTQIAPRHEDHSRSYDQWQADHSNGEAL